MEYKITKNNTKNDKNKLTEKNLKFVKSEKRKQFEREKLRWEKKLLGEYKEEVVGKCTMPGCRNVIYEDCEYFTDDSENIFCSSECACEWYGLKKV